MALRDASGAGVPRATVLLRGGVALSVAFVLLEALLPPGPVTSSAGSQLAAVARLALTGVLASTLLLGPGFAVRTRRRTGLPLGFVPLPGVIVLAGVGLVSWLLSPVLPAAVSAPALVLVVLVATWALAGSQVTGADASEAQVLRLGLLVLLVTTARAAWSLGPAGELFGGTVSRGLEVGDRSDSRISYHVASLVTHGFGRFSPDAHALFTPYDFSSRGPLSGLVSAPVMLAGGTSATRGLPGQAWSLFDPQGFMAYRVVMMLLALTCLLATYTFAQRLAGERVAILSALVVATTPFVVHEVGFTWPKLAAASLCLLAGHQALGRRWTSAGSLLGVGYLFHPLALLVVPTVALGALVMSGRTRMVRERVRRVVVDGARLAAGLGAVVVPWLLLNAGHNSQQGFLAYVVEAGGHERADLPEWFASRAESLLNTLVPFWVFGHEAHSPEYNSVYAPSGAVTHFFLQYWVSLPFAVGLTFLPLVLVGVGRVLRRNPLLVVVVVLVPFAVFAVYWGLVLTGLMREGLHAWLLSMLVLAAMGLSPLLRRPAVMRLFRLLVVARVLETGVMLVVPTLAATRAPLGVGHGLGDSLALLALLAALVALAVTAVRHRLPDDAPTT